MSTVQEKYPLIPVTVPPNCDFQDHVATFAIEMSLIHNVFIRGLNSMWHNAPRVKSEHEASFVGYCLSWVWLMHDHHEGEETIIFPFLETKFPMQHNVDAHHEFLDGLNNFEAYMKRVQNKEEAYDGAKVRTLLDSFADVLVKHLQDEIETLTPDHMKEYDVNELNAMLKVHTDHIQTLSWVTSLSFVLHHNDTRIAPNWPPIPTPIMWTIRNVAYWRHSDYWMFAPFSRPGPPQEYNP
ncbi:hypothetical protein CVT24_007130 [Panaeolus cyanescens]|uniref:Hemerythrin-like domain-containing protein n=1 Tax=Panaeolus cyanescens TaxID=181874 RepID=A0A409VK31_9AGAR|nr:hypothetical protein CVT24_007130 [Panaeolus cyanescens]